MTKQYDEVNNPKHYSVNAVEVTFKFEPYRLCELYGYYIGNAIKYIFRYPHKGQAIEDCQKAIWYLTKAHENFNRLPLANVQMIPTHDNLTKYMIDEFRATDYVLAKLIVSRNGMITESSILEAIATLKSEIEVYQEVKEIHT